MKNLVPILLICTVLPRNANALDLFGNTIIGGGYDINEDVTVHEGVSFEAHDINIIDSLRISNFGEIHGGITIYSNRTLELENAGVFDANVSLQSGAQLVQVITSNATLTNIGLAANYDVVVRNADGISLDQVLTVANGANTISFNNSIFTLDNMSGFIAPNDIRLSGDIILRFDNVTSSNLLLFCNVSGDGVVYVDSQALDRLHVFETYKVDQDIFVRLTRSTDYARIFNNDMGRFLNNLRASGIDNKLFSKLDIAETMDELDDILSYSVRTNPIKLMRPILLMHSYESLESMHIDDGIVFGIEPIMLYSSDVFMGGIRPNVSFNQIDDLHLKLSAYVMDIDYTDNINEYTGRSFGVDIDAQYDLSDDDFVRAHIGGDKSYFDVGPVFAENKIVNNPDGVSIYAITELGHVFDIGGSYKLSPFVGLDSEYVSIAGMQDTNIYGIGGTDIDYGYELDGLRYNYSGRLIVRTDGTYGTGINLFVWSIMDAAGADVHIGTIYNSDFGLSFNAMLNGRFRF